MRMLSPMSREWSWRMSPTLSGEIFEDFDRIVDSFLRPAVATTVNFQPSCDISESEDHYLVSFDMPGVKKEDIHIEVKGSSLVISGERKTSHNGERSYGKFERAFTLPTTVDTDKVEAQYENGVLNVAIPKTEAAKGRTIEIQSGSTGLFSRLLGSKKETRDTKSLNAS